jgi:hypothetical protein
MRLSSRRTLNKTKSKVKIRFWIWRIWINIILIMTQLSVFRSISAATMLNQQKPKPRSAININTVIKSNPSKLHVPLVIVHLEQLKSNHFKISTNRDSLCPFTWAKLKVKTSVLSSFRISFRCRRIVERILRMKMAHY